jgi:hypothetical protein
VFEKKNSNYLLLSREIIIVCDFFDQVSLLLNIVEVSCKPHDMIRNVNLQNAKKTIECDELDSGRGLKQLNVMN